MGALLLQYLILSSVVVLSSVRISSCVDQLDKQTKIGGAVIGGVLLAGVTSLPELITSISSTTLLNNPDLAFGNILGSNAFNIFILAIGNLIFWRYMLFNHTGQSNTKTNIISTIIYLMIWFSFYSLSMGKVGHVGVSSIFIVLMYYINLKFVSDEEEPEGSEEISNCSLSLLIFQFIFWGIMIVISSLFISITTDKIAQQTGIGSSFIGAMFLGVATSLPEMTSLISLIRLRNYDLAVGNIVGSNLFNFGIIAITDLFYLSGSIFEIADTSNTLLVIVGLSESIILTYMLLRKEVKNLFSYCLPSLIIVGIYFYFIASSLNNG